MTLLSLGPSPSRRDVLARRIRWFVAATITYNVIEAVVALTAGAAASSTALIGFGLDSVIEVSSAAAVAWQFSGRDPEARERIALKIIACSFFGLAVFVSVNAVRALLGGVDAEQSTIGLILAAVSLAIMPLLSYGQRRTGRELGSQSAVADSKQTLLCTYLSAVLLIGLGLNWLLGWSWADPIAALVIAGIAVKEGIQAWRGDACCAPTAALHATSTPEACGCGPNCTDACCTQDPNPDERVHPRVDNQRVENLTIDPMAAATTYRGPTTYSTQIEPTRGAWVPDACTLPTIEQPSRLAEFDDFFATKLRSQTRLDHRRLRWTLHPDAEATARDLTARESSCCSFFTFTFSAAAGLAQSPDRHSDDVVLEVSVPPAHIEVLAALAHRADTLMSRV